MNWFECKVSYDRQGESGLLEKVTESYLIDAMSFTEAEKRINIEMKPFISGGEFLVANIKRVKIADMFRDARGDKWYRCKVMFISFDDEKGVAKRTASTAFVQASDMKTALDNLLEGMKNSMADYEIAAITETAIMDVYEYAVINEEGKITELGDIQSV